MKATRDAGSSEHRYRLLSEEISLETWVTSLGNLNYGPSSGLKIRVSVVRFRPWPPFFSTAYVVESFSSIAFA